jgi:hypothetical protein
MEQEVAHIGGGCIFRCTLNISGEGTYMVHIYNVDASPVLEFRMLAGGLEWTYSVLGTFEWMDFNSQNIPTPIDNTLNGRTKWRFSNANRHRTE